MAYNETHNKRGKIMDDLETPVVEPSICKMILKDVFVSLAVTAIASGIILGVGYAWSRHDDRKRFKKSKNRNAV
jgi:hypothetical protein